MHKSEVFDNLMKELGYSEDFSVIHNEMEKKKTQVNYLCEDGAMGVYIFLIPWINKKSYVYSHFLYLDYYEPENITNKIKKLADHIYYEEKTRIGEVGWEVVYTKQPNEFDLKDRKKIVFDIYTKMFDHIKYGLCDYEPEPGDILASRPFGPKIDQGFTPSSIQKGTSQRGIIAKRFGFGPIYEDDFQYARYNNDLNLEPI